MYARGATVQGHLRWREVCAWVHGSAGRGHR